MAELDVGKLPNDVLRSLLRRYTGSDPRVVLGPGVGEDAAIVDMGDRYLVVTSDPITFATEEIGWYAVQVNANDVACCGADPLWFLATLLLPEEGTTPDLVDRIFRQIHDACGEIGATLCGGHTEITLGLDRPIVVGQMLGEVAPDQHLTTGGARVGDALLLTKGIAVEGTSIIAREWGAELEGLLSPDVLERSAGFLRDPGISIVREARIARDTGGVHALHDPTEGGLAAGLLEMAEAAAVGLRVDFERIAVLPECALLCDHLGLDPLGLIASGALLMAVESGRASAILDALGAEDIAAQVIGEVVPPDQGCHLREGAALRPIPRFARDEIARLLAGSDGGTTPG